MLLLAPAGFADVTIIGKIKRNGLGIPKKINSFQINLLSDKAHSTLRHKYAELRILVNDKISIVSKSRLLRIHHLLIFLIPYPRRCLLDSQLLSLVIFINNHLLCSRQFSVNLKMIC